MHDNPTTRIVRSFDELARLEEQWNTLLIECPQKSPMLSYAWVSSFFEHMLSKEDKWYLVAAFENSILVGVLPVIYSPFKVFGFNKPRLRTPNHAHTLGGDVITKRKNQANITLSLINAAISETPDFSTFELLRVVETSPSLTKDVQQGLPFRHIAIKTGHGYYFPVTGDAKDYFSGLTKKFRGNVRRAEKKLIANENIELKILEGKEATEKDLEKFMEIEACGWKGREGSAIQSSAHLTDFYRSLTGKLAKSGFLRWEYLESESETLAANLSVRFGGIVVLWKLGYLESYKKLSPGSVLFKEVLENGFEDDSLSEFNLMSDTEWQTHWNPASRNYFNIYIFSRHPVIYFFCYLKKEFKIMLRKHKRAIKHILIK